MGRFLVRLVLILWLGPIALWAQDTASIVGTVTDPSGALVPNAKVVVENPQKGFVRELTTNSVGAYSVAPVPVGGYTVTVQATGFKQSIRTGITLAVGQIQRIDVTLSVGSASQQVTVTGNVVTVQTESSAQSSVITGRQIDNLDLNGRNFTALAVLIPGANPDNGFDGVDVGLSGNTNISFNGGREQYNNWMVDGGPNTDDTANTVTNTFPTIDSIDQFRISTADYSADMGRHAGANIQVVTKAGTKDFHGTGWEFVRNDHFDANPWSANRVIGVQNAPKVPLQWNNFGFTLGGPLYIPGHYNTDKSKTFFFWSEEWRKYRSGSEAGGRVPSALERQGDFSECDPASGNYNPVVASGCVLPTLNGQQVDKIPIDPNTQAMLNGLIPLPNDGPIYFTAAPKVPFNVREDSIRIDENFSDKTWVFVRYAQQGWAEQVTPALWSGSSFTTDATTFAAPEKSAVAHLVHTFSPRLVNEFIVGYTIDDWSMTQHAGPSSPDHSINKPSTWSVSNIFPGNAANPLLPLIGIFGSDVSIFENEMMKAFSYIPFITAQDNVDLSVGRHTLKFGFYGQEMHTEGINRCANNGQMYFGPGHPGSTGNALADFYLGEMSVYTECSQTNSAGIPVGGLELRDVDQWSFEPFFQDNWHVTKRLTLNLGMRYSDFTTAGDHIPPGSYSFVPSLYNPAAEAPLDVWITQYIPNPPAQIYTPNIAGNGLVHCGGPGSPLPYGCTHPTHRNFGPRLGFAYDPTGSGKTAIRGGFGVFYEIGPLSESMDGWVGGNPPVTLAPLLYNLNGYSSLAPVSPQTIFSSPAGAANINTIPLVWNFPMIMNFNLGVQHDFGHNNMLTVTYVGSQGRHLSQVRNLNQVPDGAATYQVPGLSGYGMPYCTTTGLCDVQQALIHGILPSVIFNPYQGYGTIEDQQDSANSNYNSLQAEFRHTFSKGLTLQAAYTWSHALDDSTTETGDAGLGVDDTNFHRWYASSDNNRGQMLVMNFVYDLPFFRNFGNAAVRNILGRWTISGIGTFLSGSPVTTTCSMNSLHSGNSGSLMCNSIGKLQVDKHMVVDPTFGPTLAWFDPSTLAMPTVAQLPTNGEPGMLGYNGRNVLTGPGRNNWDMALFKNFQTPWFSNEHSTLQFRLETFNTFNHTQWSSFNAFCSGATAPGEPCTGANNIGNGEVSGTWPARILQLGMRFIF